MQNVFKLMTVVLTLTTTTLFAQSNYSNYYDDYSKWSIGLQVGVNTMRGDLASFNLLNSSNSDGYDFRVGLEPAFGGNVTRMINSWWGVRGSAFFGNVSGKRDVENENQAFRARQLGGSIGLVFNPLHSYFIRTDYSTKRLGALFLFDLGASQFNNYQLDDRAGFSSLALPSEDGDLLTYFAAFGLELKYRVLENVSIDFGTTFRYHSSDRIDGRISGGNNDMTIFSYAGLTYNFGKKGKNRSLVFSSPLSHIYNTSLETKEKIDGITTDSDGDGVPNLFDQDPNTPQGVAVDGSGRPLDVDMDGIPDYMDADPFTAKGVKVDKDGRELDSDGDGVPDSRDLEPNTPPGSLVDVRGRAITGGGVTDAFLPQVYFDFNSANISNANRERLATIARVLNNDASISLTIVGHTDNVGSEEYNKKLGERRAQAVKDYFVKNFDIDASRLHVESKGKGKPMSRFNNINRRVEFFIK
jgi:OmpA-OmpF porin, OOP family